jgi:hypothetical protein
VQKPVERHASGLSLFMFKAAAEPASLPTVVVSDNGRHWSLSGLSACNHSEGGRVIYADLR